jgi:hypothetical protein
MRGVGRPGDVDNGVDITIETEIQAESIRALERAYPNYFLDTDEFIEAIRVAVS